MSPPHQLLWAKYHRASGATHPLINHLLDVATVAAELWRSAVPPALRRKVARDLGLDEDAAGAWFAAWAGLHDIGKAIPDFQLNERVPGPRAALLAAGLTDRVGFVRTQHGTASARLLMDLLRERAGLPADLAFDVAHVAGGHHGVFPNDDAIAGAALGGPAWRSAQRDLFGEFADALGLADLPRPEAQRLSEAAAMALAGLTTTADWIGSDETRFPYAGVSGQPAAYLSERRARAAAVTSDLGWQGWAPEALPPDFAAAFGPDKAPRPLQVQSMEIASALTGPALALIEAPMGEGKTEAAWWLAERSGDGAGIYFALPTMATSNQMFARVREFLERRGVRAELHLLHSHAAHVDAYTALQPSGIDGEDSGSGDHAVSAAAWFVQRKRGLLSPYAVGTVDQALLAVLQTPHFFVRLYGLAGKAVIFDEVHAYDHYMSRLLAALLRWLAELGVTVVVLSATLSARQRAALIEAYTGRPPETADFPYPCITVAQPGKPELVRTFTAQRRQTIRLERLDVDADLRDADRVAAWLDGALRAGGCAAVVCNTVDRAQRLYAALEPYFPGDQRNLFHARYPYEERAAREQRIVDHFGPDAGERRPQRAVVVATQVIEQSLDLDFDLLVTDLAPADLLLQRAGRMHRHDATPRGTGLETPRLVVMMPKEDAHGVPQFGVSALVYDPSTLLRTWLALRGRASLRLPDDIRPLVEAVYGPPPDTAGLTDALRAALEQAEQKRREDEERLAKAAAGVVIAAPDGRGTVLEQQSRMLEDDDDPSTHPAFRALTRHGDVSVQVVCLHRVGERLCLFPDGSEPVDLSHRPTAAEAKRLLERAVSLSLWGVAHPLLSKSPPPGWQRSAALRHHRALIFEHGRVRPDDGNLELELELDPALGIVVHRNGEKGAGSDGSVDL